MGPETERITYNTGAERTQERVTFWRVVNGGHGFRDWQTACKHYWNLVKGEAD